MADKDKMLVRLRPDKRGQFATKRYMTAGMMFTSEKGWYEVSAARAEELKQLHLHDDPDQPPLFDVVTADEAKKIDEKALILEERAPANRPHRVVDRAERTGVTSRGLSAAPTTGQMTTADLPRRPVPAYEGGARDDVGVLDPEDLPEEDQEASRKKAQEEDKEEGGLASVGRVAGGDPTPESKDEGRDPETGEPRHHATTGRRKPR
jgi:hypothetical protein